MTGDESAQDAIIEAILRLPMAQRRMLLRELRISGLLPVDDQVTDRAQLEIAPALGRRAKRARAGGHPRPAGAAVTFVPARELPPVKAAEPASVYQSPVRGKVVLSQADNGDDRLRAMPALPGQAPEQPIEILFDGGSRGNPGQGYGSYSLRWPGYPTQIVQLQFGPQVTSNEAEYDTLIAALEAVVSRLRDKEADLATAKLEVRGDSLLVVNQVTGLYKCIEPRLQLRRDQVHKLLHQVGSWQVRHHDRAQSGEILGH